MSDWFDPAGTSPNTLDGEWYFSCGPELIIENEIITSDRTIEDCAIKIQSTTIQNNSDVVINAGESVIIETNFELIIGSTLTID